MDRSRKVSAYGAYVSTQTDKATANEKVLERNRKGDQAKKVSNSKKESITFREFTIPLRKAHLAHPDSNKKMIEKKKPMKNSVNTTSDSQGARSDVVMRKEVTKRINRKNVSIAACAPSEASTDKKTAKELKLKEKKTSESVVDSTSEISSLKRKAKKAFNEIDELKEGSSKSNTQKVDDEDQIKLKRKKIKNVESIALQNILKNKHKVDDSYELAKEVFHWMISPFPLDTFFNLIWENKPILVQRKRTNYYDGLFSSQDLDTIVRENYIEYSVNLDVTTYEKGVRETHNSEGRVVASVMWDYFQDGCSIRLLNPQTYSKPVWKFCSLLQEYFGSFVGCNMYLTPPGAQGFAPHYDDIEAFVLQLEGKKRWRFYNPRNESEVLPEYSSGNFKQSEIGEPSFEFVLEQGDMAYFPRGTIHQAETVSDNHSLHLTVSTCQLHSYGKYLEKVLPKALRNAFQNNVKLRKSLDLDFFANVGGIHADSKEARRKQLIGHVKQLFKDIITYAPFDEVADQLAAELMHDSLPPCLTHDEEKCMVYTTGSHWDGSQVVNSSFLDEESKIKLVRREVARLVKQDEKYNLYFTTENSRVYHGYEPQCIEIPDNMIDSIKSLLKSYPEYRSVESLPADDNDMKVDLANTLYEKGIIMTQQPISS